MKRFLPPRHDKRQTLKIILIAAALMLLIDRFVWEWSRPTAPVETSIAEAPEPGRVESSEIRDFKEAKSLMDGLDDLEGLSEEIFLSLPQPEAVPNTPAAPGPEPAAPMPVFPPENGQGAKIAIIIDDMGMDRRRSQAVVDLDGALTLAFLPYAPALDEITHRAREAGHELIIHMPMEPLSASMDPGPLALLEGMSEEEIRAALDQAFESFEGYEGINNHMGSRLTRDEQAMNVVMAELAARDLFFVDSKTIGDSVAAAAAARNGIPYAERDVFLDHEDSAAFVRASLARLEAVARARGSAVAIGHPKEATIAGLREWIPEAQKRGYRIVPVSEILRRPGGAGAAISSGAFPETGGSPLPQP